MRENPGHPGKGQCHCFFSRRKFTLHTWGWCTVWLTGSLLQLIEVLVPFMRRKCAVLDPAVSSTTHYGQGICLRSLTRYKSPSPVKFSAMDSSNTPNHNALVRQVIVCDFETLAARPYLLNRTTRTFIACCSHYESCDPTIPSSA